MSRPISGLRICGDWSATTGLANAARRLALALLHGGLEFAIAEFASGAPREPWLFPEELQTLRSGPAGPVSLWTLNINELNQVPDADLLSTSGYNIGTWFWELPTVPEWMHPQFARVSEIWAPTRFVERAMIRYTGKPVRLVPPVVPVFEADAHGDALRDQLGLPRERTIFLSSFDFNSAVSRKNPLGVVDAFARAFPKRRSSDPFLVVKAINLRPDQPFTRRLRQAVGDVGGLLIERNVSHQELAGIFHASDVYVSLHRSEGFGLGLAESMAIGKPAIGTAYSGNVDFMSAGNSCLVGYKLREIDRSDQRDNPGIEGTYVEGALWAEPDVDEAAQWMQVLESDFEQRRHIGEEGRRTITSGYSEAAVAGVAIDRLHEVFRAIGRDDQAPSARNSHVSLA